MPCWYYDKNELRDTPSVRDGLPLETERRYRKEGVCFIMACGTQMGLGYNTKATGVVYFHRFYMLQSFKKFPRYVTACCCLLLAGKVEETPKKCRDIIMIARQLLPDKHFYSFGNEPKEEVITLERILLQTIKFDLQVEHPYSFLLRYAKCFKGDQHKLQKIVQMAWNFVNDSLSTVMCLQWEPEIIAVALIYLASKLSKFKVNDWMGKQPEHTHWWHMFVSDITMDILEDICHQVLDLYQTTSKGHAATKRSHQKPVSRSGSPTSITKTTAGNNSNPSTNTYSEPHNAKTKKASSSLAATATAATSSEPTIVEALPLSANAASASYHRVHRYATHHMYLASQTKASHSLHTVQQSMAPQAPSGDGHVYPAGSAVTKLPLTSYGSYNEGPSHYATEIFSKPSGVTPPPCVATNSPSSSSCNQLPPSDFYSCRGKQTH